jgi:hypothetical protein
MDALRDAIRYLEIAGEDDPEALNWSRACAAIAQVEALTRIAVALERLVISVDGGNSAIRTAPPTNNDEGE